MIMYQNIIACDFGLAYFGIRLYAPNMEALEKHLLILDQRHIRKTGVIIQIIFVGEKKTNKVQKNRNNGYDNENGLRRRYEI
jgi:hypothetical protein